MIQRRKGLTRFRKLKLEKILLAGIALTYLGLAIFYNMTVPLWETPDEVGHFNYSVYIVENLSLPKLEEGELGESHQPPLYYALAALWLLPVNLDHPTGRFTLNPNFVHTGQGGHDPNAALHDPAERRFPYQGWSLGLHLVRFFSSLLGLGTVILTFLITKQVFPDHPQVPLLATTLVGFNPQFIFISASANNDNLLILSTTALLWVTLKILRQSQERPPTLKMSLWLGFGALITFLTKMLGIAILGSVFAVLALVIWRRHGMLTCIRWLTPAVLIVIIGSSWWWLRNWSLYGDPLGYQAYKDVFSVNLRTMPLTASEWQLFAKTQFQSYWGVFGWMNVYAPQTFFRAIRWLVGLSTIGWIVTLVRPRTRQHLQLTSVLLVGAVLVQEALILIIIQQSDGTMWQGRYLFPAAGAIGAVLAGGLVCWTQKRSLSTIVAAGTGLGLLTAALWLPGAVIQPAYAGPVTLDQVSIEHPVGAAFGDTLYLHGYQLEQDALVIKLTLYWEALKKPDFDYSVFMHLLDSNDDIIGQDDQAPGAERGHPPTTWKPGEIVEATHRVSLIRAPQGNLQIRVGVYNWATGDRLLVTDMDDLQRNRQDGEVVDALDITPKSRNHAISYPKLVTILGVSLIALLIVSAALIAIRKSGKSKRESTP
jgi:4-amino-4-deoxy-L-arabinose transferase-like glycosyltransferase